MPEFVAITRTSEIPPDSARCVEINGRRIAIYNLSGEFYATDDTCAHAHASLSEGEISGDEIVCPLHFATFNIRSGECTGGPAIENLRSYAVRVAGDEILVQVD